MGNLDQFASFKISLQLINLLIASTFPGAHCAIKGGFGHFSIVDCFFELAITVKGTENGLIFSKNRLSCHLCLPLDLLMP